MLVGRDAERAATAALLDRARSGASGVLVLRGLPGSGKSTLIEDAVSAADGMQVLRTAGIESESPLAFAALQRLLRPVLGLVDQLPAPQARALRAAFGEADGEGDRFLVFLATLSLLAEAAEAAPVLVVVDDAHWLDEASAAALLFVARRLHAEAVAMLFAVRDGYLEDLDSGELPALTVAGIDENAAAEVVQGRTGVPVPAEVRERLLVETGGNPLALVELTEALSTDQLAGRAPLPRRLPLTQGVERAFLDRYQRLPEAARVFVLLAATDDTGRLATLQQAAAVLGVGDEAADEAERSGLLRSRDGAVALRHPLVRSAVYAGATSGERRAAHAALAEVLDAADPDRRAWHRAAAVHEPDEAVVAELDAVAERATRRGGHEAASAAWERAAELTIDREARARRLQAAAMASWFSAHPARARALAESARPLTVDPLRLADIDRLRARVEWNIGSPAVGHRILMHAAHDVAVQDPRRARQMAMLASAVATFGGGSGVPLSPDPLAGRDHGDALCPQDACYAELLTGFGHVGAGRLAEAAAAFRRALAAGDPGADTDLRSNLGIAAAALGDDEAVVTQHSRLLAQARESGAIVLIVYALTRRAIGDVAVADWAAASAGAAEALDLAQGTGQLTLARSPLAWLAFLAARRGNQHEAATHLAALEATSSSGAGVTEPLVRDVTRWAQAIASDAPATALHQLEQVSTPIVQQLSALDRLETAVRADRSDLAAAWAGELHELADATGSPWAAAAAVHGRALLTGGAEADELFRRALEQHERSRRRFDRARTQLAYGEFLRRSRRRVDSRTHLRAALETFDDLGASAWAERARNELRASGETARRRDASSAAELTPQELQVARVVRQGLSNRDAAAQLFVSPRTVDFHLRNVFAKLGVTSRAELATLTLE